MLGAGGLAQRAQRSAAWCVDHRWAACGIAALLCAGAGLLAAQIHFDGNPEAYLLDTDEWAEYQRFDQRYEIGESVVIAVRERGGTIFDPETVKAIAEFDRTLSELEGVERVLSIASATALRRSGEALDLRRLLRPGPVTSDSVIDLAKKVEAHAVYSQVLVDDQRETTFIFVQLAERITESKARRRTTERIRDEADRFVAQHRAIHLAGSATTKLAIAESVENDLIWFFPAGLATLLLLLWLLFNDLAASVVPLLVVAMSLSVSLAILALFGVPFSMATATIPSILVVLSLSQSIHFLAELRSQYSRVENRRAALLAAVEAFAVPSLFACTATGLGFLALLSSSLAPLRNFGFATACGIAVIYLSTLLLTPAVLSIFRYPRERTRLFPAAPFLGRTVSSFAEAGRKYLAVTLATIGLLFGGCVAALSQLQIDADFIRYLDSEHRLPRDLAVIERTLGGIDVVEIVIDGGAAETFLDPHAIARLDRIGVALREQEGMSRVFSLADYLRFAQGAIDGVAVGQGELPRTKDAIAQLALLDPTAFHSLASDEMDEARITAQIQAQSSEEVLATVESARAIVEHELKGTDMVPRFTGRPLLFARIVKTLASDFARSLALATALIFLVLLIGLRSPGFALATLVPDVFTVGITFALMAILGLDFDTNSAFVACLGIGIAVDSSVHIAARYRRAREQGAPNPGAATQYAISHAGHPVVATSILLLVAFAVLCFSSFHPTFRIGLLGAVLVFVSVQLDLFLLPVLLILADVIERKYPDETARAARPPRHQSLLE